MLTKRLLAPLLALTIISACTSKENKWTDGHSASYYRGYAHYRTALPEADGVTRYLIFEGDTLCYHSGGYTPYGF
jgi:hypothetical protein